MMRTAEEAIAWLTRRMPQQGMRLGLERMHALLDHFGHPERTLRFIHVAGTNGKGSTCAFLAQMLQQAGMDVGLFTSPYLIRYTNRIQYNGDDIPDEELVRIVQMIEPVLPAVEAVHGGVTAFELSTLVALLYYGRVARPDVIVWETGLGGRLDATNVVHPIVTVITTIGYDHQDVLGDTLAQIAAEKAGIVKAGVPLVSGVIDPEPKAVIEARARSLKANVYALGEAFSFTPDGPSRMRFRCPFGELDVTLSLAGAHQQHNAALALMTAWIVRQYAAFPIEPDDMRHAMATTHWPGRMEWMTPRLVLDGAHNIDGARALAHTLGTVPAPRIAVIGMVRAKDHEAIIATLAPVIDRWVVTEPQFFKKQDAPLLVSLIQKIDPQKPVECVPHVGEAVAVAQQHLVETEPGVVVVTGSLYVVGEARAHAQGTQTEAQGGW